MIDENDGEFRTFDEYIRILLGLDSDWKIFDTSSEVI